MADKIRWVPEFIDAITGEIDEFETGRRMGGRILEFYTIRGRKIKVVGWAWEYFWGIGVSVLSKNCVSPGKIN